MTAPRLPVVLGTLHERVRELKKYGYDLPASRKYILGKCGFRRSEVLEVGTGKGHMTACLAKKGFRVISVDLDPGTLRTAKAHLAALKLGTRVLFRKMNAGKLLFPSRSFDHVISVDFFHHAKSPVGCLREMARVTRKTLLIADLNARGMRIMDRIHKKEGGRHEAGRITFPAIKAWLQKNGFAVTGFHHTCHQMILAKRGSG